MKMNLSMDQVFRQEALRTDESFVVEAPAGSGKTALLAARYLALLERVSHPRQILAVTFTRKAAAEMSNRIVSILSRASSGEGAPLENEWENLLLSLGRKALDRHRSHPARLFNPESLQVGTFHGFCASLVRDWPLEAEIPPGLTLLDEADQADLLERAVTQYVEDVVSHKASSAEVEAYRRCLTTMNNNAEAFSKQLQDLLARRDRLRPLLELFGRRDEKSLSEGLRNRLERYVNLYLSALQRHFEREQGNWKGLKKALRGSELEKSFPEEVPGIGLTEIGRWKGVANVFLTSQGTPRKLFGPKSNFPEGFGKTPAAKWIKELPKAISDQLHFVRGWPAPGKDDTGHGELSDLLVVFGGALARFQELLRARGLDYLELEMAALRALNKAEHPSQSLIFYHEHLRHILVDEAQDLNDLQVEILSKLTEGWEPGDGRTVFMVGDPKQSIYRFRRAEVSLFYELKEGGLRREGESPFSLKPLTLSANFRSRPHLVQFANDLFQKVMADPRPIYDEVAFSPSWPLREDSPSPFPVTVAVFNEEETLPGTEGPREREARWVSATIAKLQSDRPEDTIGILVPVRTHLATFLKTLRELKVPVCLLEGEPLAGRPEVLHLLNLFKALVRPYDDVAWAGAIRAPWCHVSDEVLLELASGEGPWSKRILSGEDRWPEVSRFRQCVHEATKMFGREPYARTLGTLWEDLDGPRLTAMRFGLSGVSNVKTFLDLLASCSGRLAEEALERVSRLLETAYTPPDPKGAFSNVQMMTIHKAKGLEFDHVFCIQMNYSPLGGGRGEEPAYRMARLPGERKAFLIAASKDRRTGEHSLASYLLKDLDQQRALAEGRRLFYVAATRAKESLTISGIGRVPKKEEEPVDFKSPLSAFLKILSIKGSIRSPISIMENPQPPEGGSIGSTIRVVQPSVPPFEAVPIPYRIVSPSRLEDETLLAAPAGSEEDEGGRRIRGLVVHRLLETLSKGAPLPDHEAVAMALSAEGMDLAEARQGAPGALKEALTAWDLEEFRVLREKALRIDAEWALEDMDGRERLRVGRFDLLIRLEKGWIVVDYKTAPPEGDVEDWIRTQVARYRFQLRSYMEMLAKMLDAQDEAVKGAILFTALPRLVYL